MSDLYRINEVPDPTGQLADILSELFDSSALVEANPDYEAAARSYSAEVGRRSGTNLAWEVMYPEEQADFLRVSTAAVNAALHIDPPEET